MNTENNVVAAAEQDMVTAPPAEGPASVPRRRKEKEHGWLAGSLQSLAATVVIALFVITFVVQAFQIPSESMENTLLIGDYLLVDKVHFGHGGSWGRVLPYRDIARGDIVVFRYPVNPAQHFVKRVIAVPGDSVRLINKRVYVNGTPVNEDYVIFHASDRDRYRDDFPSIEHLPPEIESYWWRELRKLVSGSALVVPPHQYFVMGDNRDRSYDSRYWGFVPEENVIGRPLLIYWSVQGAERLPEINGTEDRFYGLTYAVTHVFQNTRWNRTFRLVK